MLSGYQPFYSKYVTNLIELIKVGRIDFDSEIWIQTSETAKDLIRKLMDVNPEKRLSGFTCLKHYWFMSNGQLNGKSKKIGSQFKHNLVLNQKKLTRTHLTGFVLDKNSSSFNSFNRYCKQSLYLKEFKLENPRSHE